MLALSLPSRIRAPAFRRVNASGCGRGSIVYPILPGMAAAWGVVTGLMQMDFAWLWPQAFGAVVVALALTVGLGLAGTWRVLGLRPARFLREG